MPIEKKSEPCKLIIGDNKCKIFMVKVQLCCTILFMLTMFTNQNKMKEINLDAAQKFKLDGAKKYK